MRTSRRRRQAFTLVEMLLSLTLVGLLFVMTWHVFLSGRRSLESTKRKVEATMASHVLFEYMRHDLECAEWCFGAGAPDSYDPSGRNSQLGGSHRITMGRGGNAPGSFAPTAVKKIYSNNPAGSQGPGGLFIGAGNLPFETRDVRWYAQPNAVVKCLICTDHSKQPENKTNPVRERSSLVSKVFVEPQFEELRHRNHIWESEHAWCVNGASMHYAFTD